MRSEWDRQEDLFIQAIQPTYLVKRWFGKDYQGNVYAYAGLGQASGIHGRSSEETAGFAGLMADWETRRHFMGYNARYLDAGDFGGRFMQSARIGYAPYEGDTGDLHTWFMLAVDHRPQARKNLAATPLVRFFKGPALVEVGYNVTESQPLVNFTYRF